MKGLFLHVEDEVGVEVLAIDASLKVEVFGGGASRTSKQGDGLSGFDGISAVYQVFGVMAIDGFQPEGVAHDYHVAVCAVVLGHAYHSVESAPYGVFGVGLDVDAAVPSPSPSVWRDDFSAGQGEGVFAIQYGFQGEFYFVSLREQSGGGDADVVDFHGGKAVFLFLCRGIEREQQQTAGKNMVSHGMVLFKILYGSTGGGSVFL